MIALALLASERYVGSFTAVWQKAVHTPREHYALHYIKYARTGTAFAPLPDTFLG